MRLLLVSGLLTLILGAAGIGQSSVRAQSGGNSSPPAYSVTGTCVPVPNNGEPEVQVGAVHGEMQGDHLQLTVSMSGTLYPSQPPYSPSQAVASVATGVGSYVTTSGWSAVTTPSTQVSSWGIRDRTGDAGMTAGWTSPPNIPTSWSLQVTVPLTAATNTWPLNVYAWYQATQSGPQPAMRAWCYAEWHRYLPLAFRQHG